MLRHAGAIVGLNTKVSAESLAILFCQHIAEANLKILKLPQHIFVDILNIHT